MTEKLESNNLNLSDPCHSSKTKIIHLMERCSLVLRIECNGLPSIASLSWCKKKDRSSEREDLCINFCIWQEDKDEYLKKIVELTVPSESLAALMGLYQTLRGA